MQSSVRRGQLRTQASIGAVEHQGERVLLALFDVRFELHPFLEHATEHLPRWSVVAPAGGLAVMS